MKLKEIEASQIITLNDYPIRNEQILKLYFRMFQRGGKGIVPPCPVVHRKIVNFEGRLKEEFEKFCDTHSHAEYFLLDGSHKTTAATLAGKKISVMVFESDKDIKKAEEMVKNGKLISLTVEESIEKNINFLNRHFRKSERFWTVEEKTRKLVKEKKVPEYMRRRGR